MVDFAQKNRDGGLDDVLVEIPPGRYLMAEKTAYVKIEKGQSVIVGGSDEGPEVEANTNAAAWSAWANVDTLTLQANTASVDVELFVALT